MELEFNWRNFQEFFSVEPLSGLRPIYVVLDSEQNRILSIYEERESLDEFLGKSLQDLVQRYPARKILAIYQKDMMEGFKKLEPRSHFYEQLQDLKQDFLESAMWAQGTDDLRRYSKLDQQFFESLGESIGQRHFLLEAVRSWWKALFPKSYGIFIRVHGQVTRDFLLLFRGRKLVLSHEPDLGHLGDQRSRKMDEVVEYLSGKHLLRVQGIQTHDSEWKSWSKGGDHWRKIAGALRGRRLSFYPKRRGLYFLIYIRAFLGL